MSQPRYRAPRLFFSQHYTISYRHEKRTNWLGDEGAAYGLIFLFRGRLSYESATATGELTSGECLLLNPVTGLRYRANDATLLALAIAPGFIVDCAVRTRLGSKGNQITLHMSENVKDETLSRLARDLRQETVEAESGYEAVIAALMEQLVIHLLRNYASLRRTEALELSRVGLVDRRIRRALELMHAQLEQELSLRELAEASYLSTFHFARLFKKLTGTTPHAYLAALRRAMAQRLLAETDLSITEISARVGHSSPSHFTRAFRQSTGLTPSAFRASLVARPRAHRFGNGDSQQVVS